MGRPPSVISTCHQNVPRHGREKSALARPVICARLFQSARLENEVWTLERRDDRQKTFVGAATSDFLEFEEELEPAPHHFEEDATVTTEHLIEIDLGDASQKRPTFIGTGLSEVEQRDLIHLLKD